MTMPTEDQSDRAEKLGRLAARQGASVTSCPFPADVDGDPTDRVLASRFVAGYVAAGGTVDGIGDDDQADEPETTTAAAATAGPKHTPSQVCDCPKPPDRAGRPYHCAANTGRARAYGHLGY